MKVNVHNYVKKSRNCASKIILVKNKRARKTSELGAV